MSADAKAGSSRRRTSCRSWPFVAPPDLGAGERIRHPVVIAGGGLAGLTLACDLALRGVRAVLLDEDDTVGVRGASSRGICYAQKSLEIFERLGIYERIRAKGITWSVGRTFSGARRDLQLQPEGREPLRAAALHQPAAVLPRVVPGRPHPRARRRTDLRWKNKVLRGRARATTASSSRSRRRPATTRSSADWFIDATGANSRDPRRDGPRGRTPRAAPTAGASATCASRCRSRSSAGPGSTRPSTKAAPSGST